MQNLKFSRFSFLLAAVILPVAAQSQSFNPVAPALGFNVFTNHSLKFVSGHTDGPIATAGSLVLAGEHDACNSTNGSFPNGNAGGNYGLVVGGRIYYNGGQTSKILSGGLLRLGDITGTTLLDKDNNNATLNLRAIPATGSYNSSTNYVTLSTKQSVNSAKGSNGINFATAFTDLRNNTNAINNYNISQINSSTFNFSSIPGGTGGNKTINIVSGKVNYINISGSQLTAMAPSNSNASYEFSETLSASTIVIFNIQDTGSYTWYPPNLARIGGPDGSFILWNFAALAKLDIAGANSTYGTIFAPNTNVIKSKGNNSEGAIISDSATLAYGEVHYQIFKGTLPGGSNLPPTPSGGSNPLAKNTPLPVTKLVLNASVSQNNTAQLNWEIKTTTELTEMVLEVSTNATDYAAIAHLPLPELESASGFISDNNAHNGAVYYRIVTTTVTGQKAYSNVAVLHFAGMVNRQVFPNPFTDRINVTGASAGEPTQWTIFDAQGRSLRSGSIQGNATISDLANLPSSNYMLQLVEGKNSKHFSLIKQ